MFSSRISNNPLWRRRFLAAPGSTMKTSKPEPTTGVWFVVCIWKALPSYLKSFQRTTLICSPPMGWWVFGQFSLSFSPHTVYAESQRTIRNHFAACPSECPSLLIDFARYFISVACMNPGKWEVEEEQQHISRINFANSIWIARWRTRLDVLSILISFFLRYYRKLRTTEGKKRYEQQFFNTGIFVIIAKFYQSNDFYKN